MIHYWECRRCTNRWSSCCGGYGDPKEKIREHNRELWSHLCNSCYKALKESDSREWHLLNEICHLHDKIDALEQIVGLFGDLTKQVEFELPKTPERLEKELDQHRGLVECRKSMGLETLGEYPHVIVRYKEN
jgi:hypothetical protein